MPSAVLLSKFPVGSSWPGKRPPSVVPRRIILPAYGSSVWSSRHGTTASPPFCGWLPNYACLSNWEALHFPLPLIRASSGETGKQIQKLYFENGLNRQSAFYKATDSYKIPHPWKDCLTHPIGSIEYFCRNPKAPE